MIRLYLLLPVAAILGCLHALPFMPHPDRLFGVAVSGEVRYGTAGRQLLRRYQFHLLPWTAAAFLAALSLPVSWSFVWIELVSLAPLIAACWIYARRYAEARRFGLPTPSTREAQLTESDDHLFRQGMLFLLPVALLAATAIYLHDHWDRIPARFPIHWGAHGIPNGWSTRSAAGVYGPLLLGAFIILFLAGIFAITVWGSRRGTQQRIGQIVVIVVASLIGVTFSLVGLLPLYVTPPWALLGIQAAFMAFIGVMIWSSLRRHSEGGSAAGEITPAECWHGGQFYYNPRDPALFVEKLAGMGWTFNFGNRMSWIVFALMLLIPAGLAFLAFAFTRQ